jgi:MFS family permease
MTTAFPDRKAAREFCVLSIATFLCFTTTTQTALLAVVMKSHGMPLQQTGIVLSAYGAAVVIFTLVAGPFATRRGNLSTLKLGLALMLVAHVSYQFTIGYFPLAVLSRFVQGIGYGLFMPSAMAFARSKLGEERLVYFFGLYSVMVPLPNAVGPPLAEAFLKAFGDHWLFIVGAVPGAIAVSLSGSLTDRRPQPVQGPAQSLMRTACLPGLRQPLIAILVVGALYGLILSYLAPILTDKRVPLGFFYTTFTVVLLASRFALMRYVEGWARDAAISFGVVLMGTAYLIVAWSADRLSISLAGLLFGLGYSIGYPMLSIWVTEQFEPDHRTTPLAIFNAVFAAGILLTPWLGAYLISTVGDAGLLYALAGCGFVLPPYILFRRKRRQRDGELRPLFRTRDPRSLSE